MAAARIEKDAQERGGVMPQMDEHTLKFHGHFYGSGTKVLIEDFGEVKTAVFWNTLLHPEKSRFECIGQYNGQYVSDSCKVIKILEPIDASLENTHLRQSNNQNACTNGYPSQGDVQMGWVWYIIVMLFAFICEDKIVIWGTTTVIFWLWLKTKR